MHGAIVFRQLAKGGARFEQDAQAAYVTAGEYGQYLISAIGRQDFSCYLHKFLAPEMLVIDEAEYFDGKVETQKELAKLLKQRVNDNKKTVIISELGIEHTLGAIDEELMPYLTTEALSAITPRKTIETAIPAAAFVDPTVLQSPGSVLPGDLEEVRNICKKQLDAIYGKQPPQAISDRLDEELSLLGKNASIYLISHHLVKHLRSKGALTGYRHYIGSTLMAYLLGISDVNPLPAHYYCPSCKHTEFADSASGYDLPAKPCPHCGKPMRGDGHNIPYEVCMGLNGKKDPLIDIQTLPEMQDEAAAFLKDLVGADKIAFAGDCQTSTDSFFFLPSRMQWEDVTPLRDAKQPKGGITKATHKDISALDLPKLDVIPDETYRMLAELISLTGICPDEIDYSDPGVYQLFKNLDVGGIPEFDSEIARDILAYLDEVNFDTLVRADSMLHGLHVWTENAEDLVQEHPFAELISNRDDVFRTLLKYGVDRTEAFKIMEYVRKGKLAWDIDHAEIPANTKRWLEILEAAQIPGWYIASLSKIGYLTTKAHIAHRTKLAVSFAWFKCHYPEALYRVLPVD